MYTGFLQGGTSAILVLLATIVPVVSEPGDPTDGSPASTKHLVGLDQWQSHLPRISLVQQPLSPSDTKTASLVCILSL